MKLEDIWSEFAEKISEKILYHRAIKETTKSELLLITKNLKEIKNRPELAGLSSALHNMSFIEAKTGERRFYGHFKRTIEQRYLDALLHKNVQYRWLLAESYEEYEDYLLKMYAYAGKSNNDFWPLRDYGESTLSQLESKDFNWYLSQATNKKNIPSSILNRFRDNYQIIKNTEVLNSLNINLTLAIKLIEMLRHIIVHKNGMVSNKSDFIDLTLKKCGLYNNGKPKKEYIEFINDYFGEDEYENMITLLEIKIPYNMPIDVEYNVFENLVNFLMAHAYLIFETMQNEHN